VTPQEHILDICDALLNANINTDTLISEYGSPFPTQDYRKVTTESTHPAFNTITVLQEGPQNPTPEIVMLTVNADQHLTIGDLESIFGVYQKVSGNLYETPKVAYFYKSDSTIVCTVFASYEPLSDLTAQTPIIEVMIRKE